MKKLIFAPMATLSHEAMRRLIYRFGGCDEYYTEMIQAGSLINAGPFEKYYISTGPDVSKIVWQLTDSHSDKLIKASSIVSQLGGLGVDINMGCSAPEIYKQGAGIAWMMKSHSETQKLLEGVKAILPSNMRLSIKIRLGDDKFTDEGFFSFCQMAALSGVERIVLHPRTRREKYSRPPRLEYVKHLCDFMGEKFPNVSIILNGGVCDQTSAQNAIENFPNIEGIMIGRAAIQKPWIFAQIAQCMPADLKDAPGVYRIDLIKTAFDFFDYLEKYQPPEFYKTRAARFCVYYSSNFSFSHYLQTNLLNATDIDGMRNVFESYTKEMSDDRYILVNC